jgi:hypothetical protein
MEAPPKLWLTVPWAQPLRLPDDCTTIDAFSIVTKREYREALWDAVIAARRLSTKSATVHWRLQSYTALRWFVVRAAIDKLPGSLVMAEHFDRWAVLVDRSAGRSSIGARRSLGLVQHGSVTALSNVDDRSSGLPRFATRLLNVTHLYVYGPAEEAVFRDVILGRSALAQAPQIRHFRPSIELHGIGDKPRSILFVGHSMCEEFQASVYRRISRDTDLRIFYKPHPLAPMSSAAAQVGWTIISDSNWFPKVDLLISYPSTLVAEYGAMGIPAVTHSLNAGCDSADFVATEVEARMGLRADAAIA